MVMAGSVVLLPRFEVVVGRVGGDCGTAKAITTASSRAVGRCRDEYSFRKRAGGTDRPGIGDDDVGCWLDRVGTGTLANP